mmetsp:Transcript_33437/g.53903  ORF Transcript_33437/g.53903 Transcript_33437/m.53903 type:complete len:277 (-) Transcript_33437:324-1154(-)
MNDLEFIFETVAEEGRDLEHNVEEGEETLSWTPLRLWRFIRQILVIGGRLEAAEVDVATTKILCAKTRTSGRVSFRDFLKIVVVLACEKFGDNIKSSLTKMLKSHVLTYRNIRPEIQFRVEMKSKKVEYVLETHFGFVYKLFRSLSKDMKELDETKHFQMNYNQFCDFVKDTGMIEQKHVSYKQAIRIFAYVQIDLRVTGKDPPEVSKKGHIIFWEFLEGVMALASLRFQNPFFSLEWKTEQMINLLKGISKFKSLAANFKPSAKITSHKWFEYRS